MVILTGFPPPAPKRKRIVDGEPGGGPDLGGELPELGSEEPSKLVSEICSRIKSGGIDETVLGEPNCVDSETFNLVKISVDMDGLKLVMDLLKEALMRPSRTSGSSVIPNWSSKYLALTFAEIMPLAVASRMDSSAASVMRLDLIRSL